MRVGRRSIEEEGCCGGYQVEEEDPHDAELMMNHGCVVWRCVVQRSTYLSTTHNITLVVFVVVVGGGVVDFMVGRVGLMGLS